MAQEIRFVEEFALAADRAAVLEQLVPGTDDWFYFTCLLLQQQGRLEAVDETLARWRDQTGGSGQIAEIENRQVLLKTDPATKTGWDELADKLGLWFGHAREQLDAQAALPTRLEPAGQIDRATLLTRAFNANPNSVRGIEDSGLEWLATESFKPDRRRDLLRRLTRPDAPNLVRLIADDLAHGSVRFGDFAIHRALTLKQLEELAALRKGLIDEAAYVQYMLERLAPGPEEDSQSDPAARTAHLNRLAAFTALLSPVHISLHAAVLYARLAFDLTQGVWNRDLFIAYLRTPRSGGYVNQKFIERHANRRNPVDVLATFAPAAGLAAIGDDEPLVRQYLAHFLATASDGAAFAEWIDDDYLKRLFAETKLLAGAPEGERFTALLAPSEYQSRRDRVDLIFTPTNRSYFGPEDAVVIELAVKNVKTLFVKVFEINTENFYRERGVEIDTSFNVDGLVPHEERVLERLAPPLLRTAERITFPDLQGRGVYLIELIGGGRSCRALIRKGQLRFVETRTPAGHEFRVLDENGAPLKDATLWIEGRSFAAEKTGVIRVPFTRQPGLKSAVLCQAGFATLVQFNHVEERYDLKVGIHLERETLRPRAQATALIRAGLTLAGTPVSLDLLENVALTLETRDLEGTPAQRKVENFKLFEDREATFDFQVPDRLAMVALRLTAEVPNISQGRRDAVSALAIFDLNGIDTQPLVEDIFISRMGAGAVAEGGAEYILELLGRSGEPRQRRPVSFNLKHRDFVEEIHLTLQTDARGRIELGRLEGIARFTATGPEGRSQSWTAPRDRHSLPSTIHARVGETVQIPWSGPVDGLAGGPVRADGPAERADLALFERRGDAILRDCLPQAAIRRGLVEIRGLEAGDYDLYLKPTGARIALKVSAGIDVAGTLLARTRQLERINPRPLQIAALEADGKALTIRLANATRFARVHVAVSRFLPQYPLFENLNRLYFAAPGARQCVAPESQYLSTRNLGDEYTYVIERKYAAKRPGNLWTRPGLLLQPWSLRKTTTDRLDVAEGEAPMAMPSRSAPAQDMIADGDVASLRMGLGENGDATPNLDFLGEPAVLLVNLQADKNGVVTVPLADWGAHQHIVVAAVDPENTAVRMLSLPERSATVVDLRLIEGLDPQKKFAQQQEITLLSAGKSFRIGDLRTSTFEIYDCTSKLYRLFATLLKDDATFLEFGFVARWSDLPPEEKSEKYSRYACHELNYFLFRKDPAFFEKVIRPYLANKMDKTFLDRWLLEENLAAFLAPWAYGRLNVFERILLARRIDGEGPITARGVADAAALVPPDVEGFNQRFDTALKGGALETGDPYGVGAALQEAEKSARDAMPAPASMSAPLGAMMAAYGAGGAAGKDESTRAHRISRGGPSADDGMFGEPDGPPSAGGAPAKAAKRFAAKKQARAAQREFFRDLDQTEEWAENNYYRHPIEAQNADLIPTNAFWREFAAWNGKGAFLSEHAAAAAGSYTEALLALAVIDLPFAPTAHEAQVKGVKFSLTAGSDAVIFHREIKPAEAAKDPAPILISQNFFRHSDRFEYIDDEQVEKYVTEEFLTHVVYGLHVVVTNPTSARQRLDLLVQIPTGALAVLGSRATHSKHLAIDAFETVSHEVYFYFPAPGQFGHFPVHASRDGRVVAAASAVTLNVVREPSRDTLPGEGGPPLLEAGQVAAQQPEALCRLVLPERVPVALPSARHEAPHILDLQRPALHTSA